VSRLALVTGANRGLGRETARQLAEKGVEVLLGSRDDERGKRVARELAGEGLEVTPVRIDVTDRASVGVVAAEIERAFGRLDVLVNNAGVFVGAPATATAAEMHRIFEVNVFGVVTVTEALLPLLKRSSSPRIVNVSSHVGSLTLTSEGADIPGDATARLAYACSKAALNMISAQYARAFGREPGFSHVKVNSVAPGYTATDLNDFRGTRSVSEGARAIVAAATLPDDGVTGAFLSDSGEVAW
jgi:NAD(P)-dependent dehydrogenase (short-subunit alcohol dehydrogenase family)